MSNTEIKIVNSYSSYDNQIKKDFLIEASNGKTLDFQGEVLNAQLINYVLTNPVASRKISHKGFRIKNAVIENKLILEGLVFSNFISFENCTFRCGIDLDRATISSLSLAGSEVFGNICMIGAYVKGQLNFTGTQLRERDNNSTNSSFAGTKKTEPCELVLQYAKVDGCVFLSEGFVAENEVDLVGVEIGGSLVCKGGSFLNKNGRAINAKRAKIGGDVLLTEHSNKDENGEESITPFKSEGEVKFSGAQIGGQLKCSGAKFNEPTEINLDIPSDPKCAFIAQGLRLAGPLFMDDGFEAVGEINLFNARIEGNLDCTNGSFKNANRTALSLERARIDGDVFMSGLLNNNRVVITENCKRFIANGEVNLCGANINGQLNCKNGFFENEEKNSYALKATGLIVNGPLFMSEGFEAKGGVDLLNANINATVYCRGGKFFANNGYAIQAERIKIAGDLILQYENNTKLPVCGTKLELEGGINLKKASISKGLIYHERCNRPIPDIILTGTRIGTMDVTENVWGKIENENLLDCIYNSIATVVPEKSKEMRPWIKSNSENFSPQPYRQLAKVFDEMGYEREAKDVRIEMNDQIRRSASDWKRKSWLKVTGTLIGYGYRPFNVGWIALTFWVIGVLVYSIGYNAGVMKPPALDAYQDRSAEMEIYEHYPKFNAIVYSLDVFLPIVNLHQESYWRPDKQFKDHKEHGDFIKHFVNPLKSSLGSLLLFWMYLQIIAGWLLTTLLVGGLSGLIRER